MNTVKLNVSNGMAYDLDILIQTGKFGTNRAEAVHFILQMFLFELDKTGQMARLDGTGE